MAAAALAGSAAWLGPGFLELDHHRDRIAAWASAALGQKVRIDGPIGLTLLPRPVLTAGDIRAAEGDNSVSVRELQLHVALWPLLAGRVEPRGLALQGAVLRLPWPPPPGLLTQRPPGWQHGFRVHLAESRLHCGPLELNGIDADIDADAESGAVSITGAADMLDRPWQFAVRLGGPGGDGTATLEANLSSKSGGRDTSGAFSGQVAQDGAVAGHVTGGGPDLSLLLRAPAVAWHGDGRLTASGGLMVADELALTLGATSARGAVAWRLLPAVRLDAAIAANRLDLDSWLPALLQGPPPGVPTGIDLSAEAATLAGGTLRRLRAGFEATAGGTLVREAEAVLPGDATVHLDGRMGQAFEGTARLDAADLQTTLQWLRPLAPALLDAAPGALASANVVGRLHAGPHDVSLAGLHGLINGAALTGDAALTLGARPALAAALTLDALTLDPFLPPAPASLPALGRLLAGLPARIVGFDADLTLALAHARLHGVPVDALALEGSAEDGALELRRLHISTPTVTLTASGRVGAEGRVSDGEVDAGLANAALADAAWLPRPLHGPAHVHATVGGSVESLGVGGEAALGDLRAAGTLRLDLSGGRVLGPVSVLHPGAPRLMDALGVTGTTAWLGEGSLSLTAQLDATPGHLRLDSAEIAAGLLRATFGLALEWGSGRPMLSGSVAAQTLPLPALSRHSSEPLPLGWLGSADAAVHVQAAQVLAGQSPLLDAAEADVTVEAGVLRVRELTASLSGGTIGGEATLDSSQAPPLLSVAGQASGIELPDRLFGTVPDISAGHLDAAADVSATGYSPAALVTTAAGKLRATVTDGILTGLDAGAVATALAREIGIQAGVRAALAGGATRFDRFDAAAVLARGVATLGPATVSADAATITLGGTVDLPANTLGLRAAVQPAGAGLPASALQLIGPVANPSRTIDLAALARWLGERSPVQ